MNQFLNMAQQAGLYVIARPGPYINAETDGGGIPSWVLTSPNGYRTDSEPYLSAALQWYSEIDSIITAHQITKGGDVILYQIENEYTGTSAGDLQYLADLEQQAHSDGIDVPLITCWTKQIRGIKDGPLRGVFDCTNFYPRWNVAKELGGKLTQVRTQQPDAPLMTTEMQGGWFAKVGGRCV